MDKGYGFAHATRVLLISSRPRAFLFLGIDGGLDGMLQRALKRFRSATVERKASNEKNR